MATLTGQTIKGSYKDLLQVSNSDAGIDSTLRNISDGEGTSAAFQISTAGVKFTGTMQYSSYTVAFGGNFSTGGSFSTAGQFSTSGSTYNLVLTLGANTNITLPSSGTLSTLAGSETLTNKSLTSPIITGTSGYFNNTSLRVKDTDASHALSFVPGSNLSADRAFTLITGDADRTLTMSSNISLIPTNIIRTVYNANDTWTRNSNTVMIFIQVQGSGGGGGGTTAAGGFGAGAGGGAGGYSEGWMNLTEMGTTAAITVGAAGAAGTSGNNGGAGNTSAFNPDGTGATLTALGGNGGGHFDSSATSGFATGGTGGTASNGSVNITGEAGGVAKQWANTGAVSGRGGNSRLGFGGQEQFAVSGSATGVAGGTGAGGSGGVVGGTASPAGGAGGAGQVIVTEYIGSV